MKLRKRLDEFLVQEQYCSDLRIAHSMIMTGKVLVNDKAVTKPGMSISLDSNVRLKDVEPPYVSRGGIKLAHALETFRIDVTDKVVLDAGASTGGFSDCLLQRGARKVYAVDAGFGQIRGSIANNTRVVSMEKTNISDLDMSSFSEPLDLIVADLSYLSIETAVPVLYPLVPNGSLVYLLKPSFEGMDQEHVTRKASVDEFVEHKLIELLATGYPIVSISLSPILGGNGATEYFVMLSRHRKTMSDRDITRSVREKDE